MTRQRIGSRFMAIGTIIVIAAALFYAVIAPLSDWRQSVLAERDAMRNEMHRLSLSIARLSAEKQSFVSDELIGLTWEAAQTAEATAKVQSSVNDMARETGILMRSIAPTNAFETEIPNAISFRLEFEASLDQLVPFLKTLEYGQPALVVSRANLRRLVRPNQAGTQPDLFVQIDVAAPVTLQERG